MTMVTHPVSSLQVSRCALAMSCRTRKYLLPQRLEEGSVLGTTSN